MATVGTDGGRRARRRGAVGSFAANDLHRRWRSVVATGVLAGIVAGVGIACLAGARRTDSLFDRYFDATRASQLELDPGTPTAEADRALRAMPEVESASYWAAIGAFILDDQGKLDPNYAGALNFTTDGRYLDQDLVTVTSGRRLDPTQPDEIMMSEPFADLLHAKVGTEIDLGLAPTDDNGYPTQDTPTSTVHARVVGIMVFPNDVTSSELDRIPKLFVSPAFGHLLDVPDPDPTYVGYAWYGLRLKNGDADVDAVLARWQGIVDQHNATINDPDSPNNWLNFVHRTSDVRRTAERSIRPIVTALMTFGALVLLASIVLLAQALARGVRSAREDLRLAQMLGMSSGQTIRIALVAPVMIALVAAISAITTAIIGSSQFPAGPFSVFEPNPGIDIDIGLIALAVVVVVVVPLAVAALVARGQARQPVLGERQGARRPSRLTGAMAAAGAPLPVLSAVRLTVEPGRGQSFVPTRLVLLTSVTTVVLLVTTIVFGHNLGSLSRDPERFGWRADGMIMIDGGYGRIDADTSAPWLDARDDLDGWRLVGADRTTVGGIETPGLLLGPDGGSGERLAPVLVSGRAPSSAGEVVLGKRTLKSLHLGVGDSVEVGGGDAARHMTITGVAVFPDVGPVLAVRTRLDDGIWVHADDAAVFATLTAYGAVYNALLVDMTAGKSSDDFVAAVGTSPIADPDSSLDAYGIVKPVEVQNASSAGRAQAALVTAVAIAAVLSLLLTLVTVVRRRRRDLSILSALGFTPSQLRGTVLVQGVLFGLAGAIVGTPIGVVLGRQLWRMFADTLGVVADPSVPWGAVVICVAGTIAVGLVSAVAPAISAGRLHDARWSAE
ncbi:MAG: hypothetical protein JWN99_2294 [Ilumatobacteraceae bacterium]|nr:hypothetical protein [Ilumatobacteraceae bacterium]